MTRPHPAHILSLAKRMRSSCRCTWTAADKARVIEYLAGWLPEQPSDFPLRLTVRGTTYQLEKQ